MRYHNHAAVVPLARQQRVRLPRRSLLLRCIGRIVPELAEIALRQYRAAQRGLGHRLLVTAIRDVRRDRRPFAGPLSPEPASAPRLDRFSSDELLECYRSEVRAIRAVDSETPITTNFMGTSNPSTTGNGRRKSTLFPTTATPTRLIPARRCGPRCHVTSCGRFEGPTVLLMEQAPGAVNWRPVNALPRQGRCALCLIRLWRERRRDSLLPVAPVCSRRREVPHRDASSAQRSRYATLARGATAGQ